MEWLSVFILAALLCMFAQGWTITDIQVITSSTASHAYLTPPALTHALSSS